MTRQIDENRVREIIRDTFRKSEQESIDYTDGFQAAVRAVMDELRCDAVKARYLVQQFGLGQSR